MESTGGCIVHRAEQDMAVRLLGIRAAESLHHIAQGNEVRESSELVPLAVAEGYLTTIKNELEGSHIVLPPTKIDWVIEAVSPMEPDIALSECLGGYIQKLITIRNFCHKRKNQGHPASQEVIDCATELVPVFLKLTRAVAQSRARTGETVHRGY